MKKKILVVDDEADVILFTAMRLRKRGYEVVEARDGETALRLARAQRPDLVFLDVKLPRVHGYDVAKEMKRDSNLCSVPIIFATADVTAEIQCHAKELKAADYLIKPFDPEEMFEKISRLLN